MSKAHSEYLHMILVVCGRKEGWHTQADMKLKPKLFLQYLGWLRYGCDRLGTSSANHIPLSLSMKLRDLKNLFPANKLTQFAQRRMCASEHTFSIPSRLICDSKSNRCRLAHWQLFTIKFLPLWLWNDKIDGIARNVWYSTLVLTARWSNSSHGDKMVVIYILAVLDVLFFPGRDHQWCWQ